MVLIKRKYLCPLCGATWIATGPADEKDILCAKCSEEVIAEIIKEIKNESLSSWPSSHG